MTIGSISHNKTNGNDGIKNTLLAKSCQYFKSFPCPATYSLNSIFPGVCFNFFSKITKYRSVTMEADIIIAFMGVLPALLLKNSNVSEKESDGAIFRNMLSKGNNIARFITKMSRANAAALLSMEAWAKIVFLFGKFINCMNSDSIFICFDFA